MVMVHRPYLFVLFGLTVCVCLYEIAYVQRGGDDATSAVPNLVASPDEGGGPEQKLPLSSAIKGKPSANSEPSEVGAPNRVILSSGKLGRNRGEQEEFVSTIIAETLPKTDFRNLIDIKDDFNFLINQKPCPKSVRTVYSNGTVRITPSNLLVLVLVHSAPINFRKRLTIRQTWGSNPDPGMRVYFMLGAVDSPLLQYQIELENDRFGDLIQGNFSDSYRNMTYKHAMALKWFSYFCADTPILLKTDDDVFVNSLSLMDYVRHNVDGVRSKRRLVKCKVVKDAQVKRSYRSKWRVSTKEYSQASYPPYCPGFVILYSADIVPLLYREVQLSRYFWIDDVHVTGTLMQQLNASLTPFRDVYFKVNELHRLTEPYVRNMPLFTSPDLTEKKIRRMWLIAAGEDEKQMNDRYLEELLALPFISEGPNSTSGALAVEGRGLVIIFGFLIVIFTWEESGIFVGKS